MFHRQDLYKIVEICGKDSIKEARIEIIEDTSNDPEAEPSPIEHICGIVEKKNEQNHLSKVFLVIADHRTVSYINLTPFLNQTNLARS